MMALVDKSISSDFVSLVSVLDLVLKNFKVQLQCGLNLFYF